MMTRPHDERPHVSLTNPVASFYVPDIDRLQLFYTEGPRAGLEAPFPGPNDASKLRRSVASTHQQGMPSHFMAPFDCKPELTLQQVSSRLAPELETLLGLFVVGLDLCLCLLRRLRSRLAQFPSCPVMLVRDP